MERIALSVVFPVFSPFSTWNLCVLLWQSIFYDLAADPPNSNPATIQTQFGHTYPREFEGIVDLNAELTAIIDEITASQAASLKHFWDINQAFLKYRDGHVIAASPEEQFIEYVASW